jgi:hypothetical protein
MKGSTQEAVETSNEYPFPVTEVEPDRPDRLYTEDQFKWAIEAIVPDTADVIVSSRMTRTVADVEKHRPSGDVTEVKVSYKIFDDEEVLRDAGWEVIVSCLDDLDALAE